MACHQPSVTQRSAHGGGLVTSKMTSLSARAKCTGTGTGTGVPGSSGSRPRVATVCRGRADRDRGGRSASSSDKKLGVGISSKGVLPSKILSTNPVVPTSDSEGQEDKGHMTVYSVRVTTSTERDSQLSDLSAGLWMCLIGADGSSFLHRFSPITDPTALKQQLTDICENPSWEETGANCSPETVMRSAGSDGSAAKRRFVEGSVDEESFIGPDLGPLSAVLIGPEAGSYRLHELVVNSSRTGHSDRFICRERMGEGTRDRSAVYLTPVPEDAVVFGSGESAVVLSKEEAAKMHSLGMQEYSGLKENLIITNFALVCGGSSLAALIGGPEAMGLFAIGGGMGIYYQWCLQSAVDNLPASLPVDYDASPMEQTSLLDIFSTAVSRAVGTPPVRFLMAVVLTASAAVAVTKFSGLPEDVGHNEHVAESLLTVACGFLLYKVSVVAVTLSPAKTAATVPQVSRKKVE